MPIFCREIVTPVKISDGLKFIIINVINKLGPVKAGSILPYHEDNEYFHVRGPKSKKSGATHSTFGSFVANSLRR